MSQPSQMARYSGPAPRSEIVTADIGDALKKPDWKSKFLTPKSVFTGVGCILLGMLSIVPIWNSVILLQDSNYVFWAGRTTPTGIIICCVIIVILYAITVSVFFRRSHQSVLATENTIMMIANIFITLFGLFLMIASIPISHQTDLTYTNLMNRCGYSDQTHRLYEYSEVLHNIRADPKCANKFSVEECEGYEEAAPYTNFLKGMENNFRCAGFCYKPKRAAAAASFIDKKQRTRLHTDHMTPVSLIAEDADTSDTIEAAARYPPALFSDSHFQASCEGMAARDMKNFAGAIGNQTFFQGVAFVFIAVITGFLKLVSFCQPKA